MIARKQRGAAIAWGAVLLCTGACNEIEGFRAGQLTGPGGTGGTTTAPTGGGGTTMIGTAGTGTGADTGSSTGGTGGATSSGSSGGGTGGTGGSTTTTTTTVTNTGLQCNYPTVSSCELGEVCCYDKSSSDPMDFCGAPGSCGPPSIYAQLACDSHDDCAVGESCCIYFVDGNPSEPHSSFCDPECVLNFHELPACLTDLDCDPPASKCDAVLGAEYSGYKFCTYP